VTELHGAALQAHLKKLAKEQAAAHLAEDLAEDLAERLASQLTAGLAAGLAGDGSDAGGAGAGDVEPVLKLAEEDVELSKKTEDIGGVQVSRVTKTYTEPVEEMLRHDRVEVERVPINEAVTEIPPIREEGDVIIVPVVEEVLRYHRELVLKEEVRLRKVTESERFEDDVTLRRQEALVTRLEPEPEPEFSSGGESLD